MDFEKEVQEDMLQEKRDGVGQVLALAREML